MPALAKNAVFTPIPVQLSETEFNQFILPYLSMPKRGPKCKLGYHRVFNLILWVLYTGMQWKCLPVPKDRNGKAEIHYNTVYKVFAKWADDGSLEHAFIASVGHLSDHHRLDLNVLVRRVGGMYERVLDVRVEGDLTLYAPALSLPNGLNLETERGV